MSDLERTREVTLDFRHLNSIIATGVRRASAFMRIGLRGTSDPPLTDFVLEAAISYGFWPDPLPEGVWERASDAFSHWLFGSCLKELDQHFSLFLDEAWAISEIAQLHGTTIPSSEPMPIDRRPYADTNASRKVQLVCRRLGLDVPDDCFRSLSLARNSLTHGVGRVRDRDASTNGRLEVCWMAFDITVIDGDVEVLMNDKSKFPYQTTSEGGAKVVAKGAKRTKVFNVGEKIELSLQDLAEICAFYSEQATAISQSLRQHLIKAGIPEKG